MGNIFTGLGTYPCKTEVTLAIVDTGAEHLYKYNGVYKMDVTHSFVDWPTMIGGTEVTTLLVTSDTWEPVMPNPAWWESEDGNAIWMGDDYKWRVGPVADKGTNNGDIVEKEVTRTTCPYEYVAEGDVYPCEYESSTETYDCDGEIHGPSGWQYKASNEKWVESDLIYTTLGECWTS